MTSRYVSLWPSIAEALLARHGGLSSLEDIESNLSTTVGCYIESDASKTHADFELVYAFERKARMAGVSSFEWSGGKWPKRSSPIDPGRLGKTEAYLYLVAGPKPTSGKW